MSDLILNASDRCDACQARAYVWAFNDTSKHKYGLLFCKHHYEKNENQLTSLGWSPDIDERSELYKVAKLDVSA